MSSADFNEGLRKYYNTLFPYQLIFNWFNYKDVDNKNIFKFKEFSFTLPGDIYIRYQSFSTATEFQGALIHRIPIKIDAGAFYNGNPRFLKANPDQVKPVQRELVFDIDISDYNDARTCCQDSGICKKCWPFMAIGAKILNVILTKEFGFKHILFVFSGRRGFHCWVCDKEARELGGDARRAIADYLALVKGGDNLVKRVELDSTKGLHPMICKALDVIDEHFEDLMVHKQDFLSEEHLVQNIIDLCQDDLELQKKLAAQCKLSKKSSSDCWRTIVDICNAARPKRMRYNYFLQEVKLQHCFPRIDSNVTRGVNHLLKLPFCIHPKTGKVCVPLDIETIDKFDPDSVPTIQNLSAKTLDPFVKVMKKFCDGLDAATSKR